jgi:multimeric flavodoxin WrbA
MKITILNGNTDANNSAYEDYLRQLELRLEGRGHQVTALTLRELDLRYCTGCFGCWVKTPGECVTSDDGPRLRKAILDSDFTLWAAPLVMGFPSAKLKQAMDKSIPLLEPYFEVVHGEAHHKARYGHYPLFGLLVQPEADTDAGDLEIVENMYRRTALNMKSRLCFLLQTDQPLDGLVGAIEAARLTPEKLPANPPATTGITMTPPKHLIIFNGSPRGPVSNTGLLLQQFVRGFTAGLPGAQVEVYDLVRLKHHAEYAELLAGADAALIAFPLYTDAMPGIVKAFFEALAPLRGRPGLPPMGFMVQSGFPESAHSRFVERYAEKLAARLGSPYLGTIVKGGCEGIRDQPEQMTRGLFAQFEQIGAVFGQSGRLDAGLLKKLARPEKYPLIFAPVFKLLSATGILDFWWNHELKENGAYENRFARPYAKG